MYQRRVIWYTIYVEWMWKISSFNIIFLLQGADSASHCWLRGAGSCSRSKSHHFLREILSCGCHTSHRPGISVFLDIDHSTSDHSTTKQTLHEHLFKTGQCPQHKAGEPWELERACDLYVSFGGSKHLLSNGYICSTGPHFYSKFFINSRKDPMKWLLLLVLLLLLFSL